MNTRNLLTLAALVAASGGVFGQATQNVNVGVTLTPKCEFTSTALAFTPGYIAFQTSALTANVTAAIKCTRGATAPSLTWDGGAAGVTTTVGVVRGLAYQLVATRGTITGGTAPAGALISDLGSPSTADVTIALTVPAAQAGANSGSDVLRVLTVAF